MPSHTPYDGDLVFAVSTARRKIKIEQSDIYNIGHAASICLSRAIARGVYEAKPSKNDTLPTWKEVENKRLFNKTNIKKDIILAKPPLRGVSFR